MAIGVYPGSFNPPTVAHLAIATAAREQCGLDRVDLVLSRAALGKVDHDLVDIDARLEVLLAVAETRPWLGARIADEQLIADLADGYDVVILGADKWAQVIDPRWYDDDLGARDEVLRRLPTIAWAPRAGHPRPGTGVALVLDEDHGEVSATAVRSGRVSWMLPEARDAAARTGAWIDPEPRGARR